MTLKTIVACTGEQVADKPTYADLAPDWLTGLESFVSAAGWSGIYTQWISPVQRRSMTVPVTPEQVVKFAELVAAAEREACAELADRHERAHERASEEATEEGFQELSVNMSLAAEALASAIRARSNTQPNGANPVNALEDKADLVSKAMRRAWQLGQTYWNQADSECASQNRKSDETHAKFQKLVDETRAAILAETSGGEAVQAD